MSSSDLHIFSGNANQGLAEDVAQNLGTKLGAIKVTRFRDGEVKVDVEESVRGKDVFVIQPICRLRGSVKGSVNDAFMELLVMLDAFKRASARQVVAVVPYFAYARQDRKIHPREPISARLAADLLTTAGASRVVFVDIHAQQIQGFFSIPVDNIPAGPVISDYLRREELSGPEVVIVSPDVGGVARATAYAEDLQCPLAIAVKRRPLPNQVAKTEIIGEVEGKKAVVVDDMIDTGGTVIKATKELLEKGATEVYVCCTHPVLSDGATEEINKSPVRRLVVTNTIPLPDEKRSPKIEVLDISKLLATTIKCIYENRSVSKEFARYW